MIDTYKTASGDAATGRSNGNGAAGGMHRYIIVRVSNWPSGDLVALVGRFNRKVLGRRTEVNAVYVPENATPGDWMLGVRSLRADQHLTANAPFEGYRVITVGRDGRRELLTPTKTVALSSWYSNGYTSVVAEQWDALAVAYSDLLLPTLEQSVPARALGKLGLVRARSWPKP